MSIVDATVDNIVQEAEVARGTFYIYFKDKHDILKVLAARVNDELFSESHLTLDPSVTTFERIRMSLRRVVDMWTAHAGLFRSMNQMALTSPEFLQLDQELRLEFIDQISRGLDASVERGRAKHIDTAVASKALSAMMDRFCLLWFACNEPPYAEASEEIDHVVDNLSLLWYRAVYGRDPDGIDARLVASRPERVELTADGKPAD